MMYMLDTSICIYLMKKKPESVVHKFKLLNPADVCISSVTLSELMYGVEKSQYPQKNKIALEAFVLPLEIVSYDANSAHHYGHIRACFEKKGAPIGSLDLMIEAHAQSLNAIFVTNNTKEFLRVPNLKVEDWVNR